MIASGYFKFFGHQWQPLGTSYDPFEKIFATTGVDSETLMGASPRSSGIARIFWWASRRVTTRVEDQAYSLLGLLDVSMMPMYGEGERAFMRLQEILVSQYDDSSIFAWSIEERQEYPAYDFAMAIQGTAPSSIFARSPAAFANSGDVWPVMHNSERLGPPIQNTPYGVHINGKGFVFSDDNEKSLQLSCQMYIQLGCCVKKTENGGMPIGLILEIVEDRDRPRCVRRGIVGLLGVRLPETMKQAMTKKFQGGDSQLVRLDAFVAKDIQSEIICLEQLGCLQFWI
ncbi:hypothetical protein Sste5346_002465 [Sporothrix stenoceras]|uniref:DUF8212 domain-containing protein n=1 Tax=Sporothrix stenoceras TaxID=5173 RepID=A0ABR3ZIB6_9PEZI